MFELRGVAWSIRAVCGENFIWTKILNGQKGQKMTKNGKFSISKWPNLVKQWPKNGDNGRKWQKWPKMAKFRFQNGLVCEFSAKKATCEPKIPWMRNCIFVMSVHFRPENFICTKISISKWPCLQIFGPKIPISEPKIPFLGVKLFFVIQYIFGPLSTLFNLVDFPKIGIEF